MCPGRRAGPVDRTVSSSAPAPPSGTRCPEGAEERILRAADAVLRRQVAELSDWGDPTSRSPASSLPRSA